MAKESNFNAIRIWGGCNYEIDEFYEYAAQLNIMIIHDFMFANGMYLYNHPLFKRDIDNELY